MCVQVWGQESQSTPKAASGKADGGQKEGLLWMHPSGNGQLVMKDKAKATFTLSFNGKISLPKQNSN